MTGRVLTDWPQCRQISLSVCPILRQSRQPHLWQAAASVPLSQTSPSVRSRFDSDSAIVAASLSILVDRWAHRPYARFFSQRQTQLVFVTLPSVHSHRRKPEEPKDSGGCVCTVTHITRHRRIVSAIVVPLRRVTTCRAIVADVSRVRPIAERRSWCNVGGRFRC